VAKKDIDRDRLSRPEDSLPPSNDSFIEQLDDVIIQVTQAFCPKGHSLVRNKQETFDGQPGISLWVSDGDKEGEVIVSPYHGDHSRKGSVDVEEGKSLTISCPECKTELPKLSACACDDHASLFGIYLTPALDEGHVAALCNVWGCHRSKVFDQAQLLSAYLVE
jgi:hypothetical protein